MNTVNWEKVKVTVFKVTAALLVAILCKQVFDLAIALFVLLSTLEADPSAIFIDVLWILLSFAGIGFWKQEWRKFKRFRR